MIVDFYLILDTINLMKDFLISLILMFAVLYLGTILIPGMYVEGNFKVMLKTLAFASLVLTGVYYILHPLIKIITFPLKILTFGLITVVVNMGFLWGLDILFPSLILSGIGPLFWASLLLGVASGIKDKL